ncbi:hypothetical protein C8J56DRAFT_522035 [Mycena floridula]|nr:hypothetical protein C8J56DRAFT_522035 [Mycena floridula]
MRETTWCEGHNPSWIPPKKLNSLLQSARNGSLSALHEVDANLTYEADDSLLPRILPILFQHMEFSKIPSIPYPEWPSEDNYPAKLTVSAFKMLAHLFQHQLVVTSASMRLSVKRNLHRLVPAIPFLLRRLEQGRESNEEWILQESLHRSMTIIFSALSDTDDFRLPLFSSYPSISSDLARIWLLEEDVIVPMYTAGSVMAQALILHLRDLDPIQVARPALIPKPIIPYFTFPPSHIAAFFLRRILFILDEKRMFDFYYLINCVALMVRFSAVWVDLQTALLEAGSVFVVSHLLRRISARKLVSRCDSLVDSIQTANDMGHGLRDRHALAFQWCMRYLLVCFRDAGRDSIITALDNQLLLAIIKSRSFSLDAGRSGSPDEEVNMILSFIEPYLFYPGILHRVNKSVRSIKSLHLESLESSSVKGSSEPFWEEWHRFLGSVEVATVARNEILETIGWKTCANPEHQASYTRNIRLCTGCAVVFYCSEKCQSDHWQSHSERCSFVRGKGRAPRHVQRNLRDVNFVTARFEADIISARADESQRTRFIRQNPGVNPRTLVLVFDYCQMPKAVSIMSGEKFKETELVEEKEKIWFDEADSGLGYLVFFIAPDGQDPLKILSIRYFADEAHEQAVD